MHFDEDYLSKKIHSHLFENCGPWGDTQNYDNWIINIKAFWNKYVAKENDNIRKAFYIGMVVIPDSIREFGSVLRRQKSGMTEDAILVMIKRDLRVLRLLKEL